MNFPPSSIPTCKVPVDSYGSPSMTTNAQQQQNHPSIMSPSTSVARPSFEHIHPYLPKHWIWSRNLFYPHLTNNNHLSALYANHGGAFSGSELSSSMSNKTESLNSNSPAQVTEINSDDSLDSHDTDKVKLKLLFFSFSLLKPKFYSILNSIQTRASCPLTINTNRKRNPYSIEELLKKPVKRKKTDNDEEGDADITRELNNSDEKDEQEKSEELTEVDVETD
jgi:hypothetical protein